MVLFICIVVDRHSALEVLSFAEDNDDKMDDNGEYTSASLERKNMPENFTLCAAFSVEAWNVDFAQVSLPAILTDDGQAWGDVRVIARSSYTSYDVYLGGLRLPSKVPTVLFPLQWTRYCLSLDSINRTISLVVDGDIIIETSYGIKERLNIPNNLKMLLGIVRVGKKVYEKTGRTTNLNMFSSALSIGRMVEMTKRDGIECGALGDFLSWDAEQWTLRSEAKVIEVNTDTEDGPCGKKKSEIYLFAADFSHTKCMQHCQKVARGRSPGLHTEEEWDRAKGQIDQLKSNNTILPWSWLSATEGDIGNQLQKLPNWPKQELVNGTSVDLFAVESRWRDYYTGERLEPWKKPFKDEDLQDTKYGAEHNCMLLFTDRPWNRCWLEWFCDYSAACLCNYPVRPILHLRGLCTSSHVSRSSLRKTFTLKQLHPEVMILLGEHTSTIAYDVEKSVWKLTDAASDVTAESKATKASYVIGRHHWRITNDSTFCNEGRPYSTDLKLTGCRQDGEFTCNDGQCVSMEERCNQVRTSSANNFFFE